MKELKKEQLSDFVKDYNIEKLAMSLRTPNFFQILRISQNEIRHSNFLAWLLSPNESHNLNTFFLKWFLKEIFSSEKINWIDEFEIDLIPLNNVKILREWNHIDILIFHEKFKIVIENKVNSSESEDQLRRYYDKVKSEFGEKTAFVFLTKSGIEPNDEFDTEHYVLIDYSFIKSRIEIILDIYKDSLSDKVKNYMEDYLFILKREIMNDEDEVTKLALEIYKNHKDVIDFIIEKKPDKISEIKEIIEKVIEENGYKLETCNKCYARFLTNELSSIVPRTGINGFKGNESFLFEISYWAKGMTFKCVISPGNELNRELLSGVIKKLPNSREAIGGKWLVYYKDHLKYNLLSETFEDENSFIDEIKEMTNKLLHRNKEIIEKVQGNIINIKDEFITDNNIKVN